MTGIKRRLCTWCVLLFVRAGMKLTGRQGNLDERCSDALIWELMLQAGPVGELHILVLLYI